MLTASTIQKIKDGFAELDLSEEYAAVYSVLLENGNVAASVIAKRIGKPRSSTYDILREMGKIGLVFEVDGSSKTLFKAEDPELIRNLIESRKRNSDIRYNNFEEVFGELESMYKSHFPDAPSLKVYDRIDDLEKILALCKDDPDVVLVASYNLEGVLSIKNPILDFIKHRSDSGLSTLISYTEVSKGVKFSFSDCIKLKSGLKSDSNLYKLVTGDKVVYIDFEKFSVWVLENEKLAQLERGIVG